MTEVNQSARDYAAAWIAARTKKARAAIQTETAAKAKTMTRKRWAKIAKAMAKGDALRVAAYASGSKADWAKVREGDQPKAAKTPKAQPKKAAKQPSLEAIAASLEGVDDAALAAFFKLVMKSRS